MNKYQLHDEARATAFLYASAKEALKSLDVFTRSAYPANDEDVKRTDMLREMVEQYEKVMGL